MIDVATHSLSPADAVTRRQDPSARGDGPGFSYALAAAALEKNASKSLQAHGARPSETGNQPQQDSANSRSDAERASDRQSFRAETRAPRETPSLRLSESTQSPIAQPAAPQIAASAASSSTAVLGSINSTPAPLAAKLSEAAAIRDLTEAKVKLAAPKAARPPAEPAALKTAFAEILARRLEKTSVFDLRLDPPDLGRVEGRLAIDDSGKSVLSLSFDNQSAFDLYSRDEQALRLALQQSGLNFADGDFVFAFKEQPETSAPPTTGAASVTADAGPYEPSFFANWSAGALDIRI